MEEGAGGGVPSCKGVWGPHPEICCYLVTLWCNLRHFEPIQVSERVPVDFVWTSNGQG